MIDDSQYIIAKLEKEVKTLPDRKNRCIQHLAELGYIPLTSVNALTPSVVEKAKNDFLDDAATSGLYSGLELLKLTFEDEDDFLTGLLSKAVDIDEGFVFDELPGPGERNLITRIIHYRLDIFGMWEYPVDAKFSNAFSLTKIKEIAEFARCTPLEAINLTADVEKLTKQLLAVNDNERFILAFRPKKSPDKGFTQKLNRQHKFRRQLTEDFGEKTDFIKHIIKDVLRNNSELTDQNFLFKRSTDPFSRFILRIIQVHQWQEGLYEGLLDSDIGEVTLKSIITATELYNITDRKNIRMHRILTYVSNGYFLFNALFFMQEYMTGENSADDIVDAESIVLGNIIDSASRADETSLTAFQMKLNVLKAEITATNATPPREKQGLLKRVYFGIRKLFRKIIRISKKIFRMVTELSRRFKSFLKKIFGHLFDKLSKGIKAFLDGIKYLTGKKSTISISGNNLIASVFRIDGDSFSIASGDVAPLVPGHLKKINYHVTSMAFSMAVTGGALKLIINALNILSWPFIIFTIINIYKNISESYKKLEFITT